MFRRMVFNVLAPNCDDHTKNFSFILSRGEPWKLAPAYDLCHAFRLGSEWVSQHALSINHKRKNITREDLMAVANTVNCKEAAAIISEVNSVVKRWKKYARMAQVQQKLKDTPSPAL